MVALGTVLADRGMSFEEVRPVAYHRHKTDEGIYRHDNEVSRNALAITTGLGLFYLVDRP